MLKKMFIIFVVFISSFLSASAYNSSDIINITSEVIDSNINYIYNVPHWKDLIITNFTTDSDKMEIWIFDNNSLVSLFEDSNVTMFVKITDSLWVQDYKITWWGFNIAIMWYLVDEGEELWVSALDKKLDIIVTQLWDINILIYLIFMIIVWYILFFTLKWWLFN